MSMIVVNVKFIFLSFTCLFCKEFCFCILGCSINIFGGDSYRVETSQLIALHVDCLVSMRREIFHRRIFEHCVILSECFSLVLSKVFNWDASSDNCKVQGQFSQIACLLVGLYILQFFLKNGMICWDTFQR